LQLVLENAKDFKKSIDAIAVLIDEAELIVGPEGISLKATDPSQISMIDFNLPKNAFKKFDVKEERALGLDLDYLRQVMSRGKPSDQLTMTINQEKTVLFISFKGDSKREFSIPLIDVSKGQVPNPKIEFDSQVTLKAGVVQDALKDAELVSTHITLGVDEKSFFVKANSSRGTMDSETAKDEKTVVKFSVKGDAKSTFPRDYLSDMLKAADSDTSVVMHLKSDAPIKLSYSIGEASVTYLLAPRIESS